MDTRIVDLRLQIEEFGYAPVVTAVDGHFEGVGYARAGFGHDIKASAKTEQEVLVALLAIAKQREQEKG